MRFGISLLLTLLLINVAHAETPDVNRRSRARTFLMLRVSEALKLSEEQAGQVAAVIRASDDRREQLVRQRESEEKKLRAAVDKAAGGAELLPLIASTRALDQQIAAVPDKTFEELQNILSVDQQARFLLFRRELQGEVHRVMQHRLGGAHRPAPKPAHETPTPSAR